MDEQRRRDLERLKALLDAPQMNDAAIDRTYLRLIAQHLAVIALAGYQHEGRGAVVLGYTRNTMHRAHNVETLPYYLSQSNAHMSSSSFPATELEEQVEIYNPLLEFVVCMVRTPHSSVYRVLLPQPDAKTLDPQLNPSRYHSVTDDGQLGRSKGNTIDGR